MSADPISSLSETDRRGRLGVRSDAAPGAGLLRVPLEALDEVAGVAVHDLGD